MVQKIPKVITPEEQEKSGFKLTWRSCLFIIFIIAIIFVIYGLFFSSFFTVKDTELKGDTGLVNAEKVKEVVLFSLKDQPNIWLFNDKLIEDKIKENFPLVSEVKIQKGIPDTLRITIYERKPVMVWKSGEKKYFIDKEGMAYAEAEEAKAQGLPVVVDAQNVEVALREKIVSRIFVDFVREISEKFTPRSNLGIQEMKINDTTFDLNVVTQNGFSIYFDTTRSAETQLDDLRRVMAHLNGAKPKEYIDLRVDGWAYYK